MKEKKEHSRIFERIEELCALPSISGFEYKVAPNIARLWGEHFDSVYTDAVGSTLLCKKCGREGAPRILVDAHIDEIGLLVAQVLEGGFLRITNIGGIDRAVLQAADVLVYPCEGEPIGGVIISAPPHLRDGEEGKLPKIDDLLVDVGYGFTKEELEQICPVGTPVGFAPYYSRFGEYAAGKSFDDKACAAAALCAVADTPAESLAGDVYVSLSAREETSRVGAGTKNSCFGIAPHYAAALDVNLGDAPDAPKRETVPLGRGISISHSAATDRCLTELCESLCKECGIAFTPCAAPSSTGTNATDIGLVRTGVPVVDIGLPLRNMHTYNEVLCLNDVTALYAFVCKFITSCAIADAFSGEDVYE